ncbi:hypothetical protein N2152v2_006536 [Parachlorella kessleri]
MAGLLRKHWPGGDSAVAMAHAASNELQAAILHVRATSDVTDVAPDKYITFLVCKGYADQLRAFADGIAICYLLNATCVLPQWYRQYDPAGLASKIPVDMANYDPQASYAVGVDHYLDPGYFIRRMSGLVKVVASLPAWLQGETLGAYSDHYPIDPARPTTWLPLKQLLARRNVLRLRCTLNTVLWDTEEMGGLLHAIHGALKPSAQVHEAFEARQRAVARAMRVSLPSDAEGALLQPLQYLAVHVLDGSAWESYCEDQGNEVYEEAQDGGLGECYMPLADVAQQLLSWGLPQHYPHVYVASQGFSQAKAEELLSVGGLTSVTAGTASCLRESSGGVECSGFDPAQSVDVELNSAVDLLLLEHSALLVGNAYSALSWWARMARLVRRASILTPPDTLYGNADPLFTAGDLKGEEALRFGVQPGIVHPGWHSLQLPDRYWLHLQQQSGRCLHKHGWGPECTAGREPGLKLPRGAALEIVETTLSNSGFLGFKVKVQPSVEGFDWHPRLHVLVNGQPRGKFTAYLARTTEVDKPFLNGGQVGLAAMVPMLSQDLAINSSSSSSGSGGGINPTAALTVCLEGGPAPLCSANVTAKMRPPLRRDDSGGNATLWVYFPDQIRSGGPEALHQLHQAVNYWHARGEITVSSQFPQGDPYYHGPNSKFAPRLEQHHLGPRDYVMVPEHHQFNLPREFQYVMREVGTQGLVWHVGQHSGRLAQTMRGKEAFKPLCLSPYFASMLQCPVKAIINVPMAELFLELGRKEDANPSPKEDLVLFDFDETATFDPSKVKGFKRGEVIELYRKAKVYIDTFLTGQERGVFEAALLNAVPTISNHGPGRSWLDFPLPARYKWQYFDYDQLSDIIRYAVENYSQALREVRPLKEYALRMPDILSQSVRTYFQDDVHVMLPLVPERGQALSNSQRFAAFGALVAAAIQYPFSTQEIVTDDPFYAEFEVAGPLYHLLNSGLMGGYSSSQVQPEYRRFGPRAVYLQRPLARHRRDYTLVIPPSRLPLHPNLAASLFTAARRADPRPVAVFGPEEVFLADWASYYDLVNANLWFLDDHFGTADLQRLLTALRRPYLVLDRIEELPLERTSVIPWVEPHSCQVATLEMFSKLRLSPCACKDLEEMAAQGLWRGTVNMFPEGDSFVTWLREQQEHCEELLRQA